jgi:hypothetical protein
MAVFKPSNPKTVDFNLLSDYTIRCRDKLFQDGEGAAAATLDGQRKTAEPERPQVGLLIG